MSQNRKSKDGEALWFPHGLIGLPGLTRYRLISRGEDNPFLLLQSEEAEQIRFSLIDPMVIRPGYEVGLTADQIDELEAEHRSDVRIFAIVSVPEDSREMSVNLLAPIVVSSKTGVAIQILHDDERLPVRTLIVREWQREQAEMLAL